MTAWTTLLFATLAFAGADGDGFTVADGDCDDLDANIYPGAPELCDGIDNDCTEVQIVATPVILALGNGNDGESLTWNQDDGLWYHTSGISNGQEYLEPIDIDTLTVMPNLAPGNTYGPDAASELMGIVWYSPLGVFIVIDLSGNFFHVTPGGAFTNLNVGGGGGGGSGWWGGGGTSARGFAVVGNEVFGVSNYNSSLYTFDPATGIVTDTKPITIDGVPSIGCNGLTHNPINDTVWGICKNPFGGYYAGRLLVEIDVATGVGYSRGDTGQRLSGLGIDDTGRILAVSGDGNGLGLTETIYELIVSGGGGPQPGEFDLDGDGYLACEECNDNQVLVFPGAPEICDGFDSDCDGVLPADEEDADSDGVSICDGDCDDMDGLNTPGRMELCDGQDNDCDGAPNADEVDMDGDGQLGCQDCDDGDADTYVGADELCDGKDNDCDGNIQPAEQDNDGDGSLRCDDCDDADANNSPDFVETCDGHDNDCDGSPDADEGDDDGDGVRGCEGDCDDGDGLVYPNAPETADDGIDQDCDGSDLVTEPSGGGGGGGNGGKDGGEGCSCSTQPTPVGLVLVLPMALLTLRRRKA